MSGAWILLTVIGFSPAIAGIPLSKIVKVSPVFDVLVLCLLLFLVVAIERWRTYQRISLDRVSFMDKIKEFLGNKQYDEAVQYSVDANKPLANMVKIGLANRNKSPEDIAELMEASRMTERVQLEKFLPVLGTLGNSGVFIGLLGTVIGIIKAFKLLEHAGSQGASVIMIGIAEALVTTAMGLIVAIPCVIMFNIYMGKIKNWYVEMEVTSKELLAEMVGEEAASAVAAKPTKRTQASREV